MSTRGSQPARGTQQSRGCSGSCRDPPSAGAPRCRQPRATAALCSVAGGSARSTRGTGASSTFWRATAPRASTSTCGSGGPTRRRARSSPSAGSSSDRGAGAPALPLSRGAAGTKLNKGSVVQGGAGTWGWGHGGSWLGVTPLPGAEVRWRGVSLPGCRCRGSAGPPTSHHPTDNICSSSS